MESLREKRITNSYFKCPKVSVENEQAREVQADKTVEDPETEEKKKPALCIVAVY